MDEQAGWAQLLPGLSEGVQLPQVREESPQPRTYTCGPASPACECLQSQTPMRNTKQNKPAFRDNMVLSSHEEGNPRNGQVSHGGS